MQTLICSKQNSTNTFSGDKNVSFSHQNDRMIRTTRMTGSYDMYCGGQPAQLGLLSPSPRNFLQSPPPSWPCPWSTPRQSDRKQGWSANHLQPNFLHPLLPVGLAQIDPQWGGSAGPHLYTNLCTGSLVWYKEKAFELGNSTKQDWEKGMGNYLLLVELP